MMNSTMKSFGKLNAAIYDFEVEGDKLPLHVHTVENNHITIVARGSFRFSGDGWEMICKSGDVVDWEAGKRHEFTALEPNSRCVNIMKDFFNVDEGGTNGTD
jgi:quercetin dioxygenase-like cupin family protein